jgi:hypothetical protein
MDGSALLDIRTATFDVRTGRAESIDSARSMAVTR